jgi:hypothetical protein
MRLFDCSNLLDPFFNRHDIRRLRIAARPHVDDPFDSGQTARRPRALPDRPRSSVDFIGRTVSSQKLSQWFRLAS